MCEKYLIIFCIFANLKLAKRHRKKEKTYMNKGEFLKVMGEKANGSAAQAKIYYDAFVDTITAALKKGDTVALMGFGTFELKKKAARTGINPLTKEKIKIKASKTPALKFSSAYKATFNTKK